MLVDYNTNPGGCQLLGQQLIPGTNNGNGVGQDSEQVACRSNADGVSIGEWMQQFMGSKTGAFSSGQQDALDHGACFLLVS